MSMAFAKPFNRTSMELKLIFETTSSRETLPFNRTSMELKHVSAGNVSVDLLLIEPVWN